MVTGENSAMNSDGDEDEVQEVHEIKDDSDSDDGIMEVDQDDPLTAKASKGSMMDPETGEYKGKIKGPDGKLVNPSTIVSTEVKKPQVCNYFLSKFAPCLFSDFRRKVVYVTLSPELLVISKSRFVLKRIID